MSIQSGLGRRNPSKSSRPKEFKRLAKPPTLGKREGGDRRWMSTCVLCRHNLVSSISSRMGKKTRLLPLLLRFSRTLTLFFSIRSTHMLNKKSINSSTGPKAEVLSLLSFSVAASIFKEVLISFIKVFRFSLSCF